MSRCLSISLLFFYYFNYFDCQFQEPRKRFDSVYDHIHNGARTHRYAIRLEDEWYNVTELLDPVTVSRLSSYADNAVNRWLDKGTLCSALTQNSRVTSKAWLIDFICGKGMSRVKKNEWYQALLMSAK